MTVDVQANTIRHTCMVLQGELNRSDLLTRRYANTNSDPSRKSCILFGCTAFLPLTALTVAGLHEPLVDKSTNASHRAEGRSHNDWLVEQHASMHHQELVVLQGQ